MLRRKLVLSVLAVLVLWAGMSYAQVGVFTKEDLMEYTSLWKGERFPDGRPKVPEELLKRLEKATIEQAWGVGNC